MRDRVVAEHIRETVQKSDYQCTAQKKLMDVFGEASLLGKTAAICLVAGKAMGIVAMISLLAGPVIAKVSLIIYAVLIGISILTGLIDVALTHRESHGNGPTKEEVEKLARQHGLI